MTVTLTEATRILQMLLADTTRLDSVFYFANFDVSVEQIALALEAGIDALADTAEAAEEAQV